MKFKTSVMFLLLIVAIALIMAGCSQIDENVSSDISQESTSQIESSLVDNTSSEVSSELKPQSESVPSVEGEEVDGKVIGNPSPDDFQGDDFFIYQKIVCINATNIDWINELTLTEEELLGEIKRTGITENHTDWDATILPVGTKIYQHAERNDVLIAVKGDTKVPYMKMIEG